MSEQRHFDFDPSDPVVDTFVARFADGSQVLVSTYGDGTMMAAQRADRAATWGAPVPLDWTA